MSNVPGSATAVESRVREVGGRGMGWQGLATIVMQGLQAVVTLIVAATLPPSEFALWGIAAIVFNAQHLIGNLGFAPALIYFRDERMSRAALDSVFTVTAALALFVGVAAFASAPAIASLFTEGFSREDVITVVRAMSLVLVFIALTQLPQALLEKSLDFRRRAVPDIVCAVIYAVAALGLLVAGAGVWSLIIAKGIQSLLLAAAFWALSPARPRRLAFDFGLLRQLFRYSKFISASAVFGVIFVNVDSVAVGRLVGATALGSYALAYTISMLIPIFLAATLGKVFFPLYSAVRDDPTALKEAFASSLHYVAAIMVPTTAGLLVIAPPTLIEVFGREWEPAEALIRILALYGLLKALSLAANSLLSATGRPQVLLWSEALGLIVAGALVWPLSAWDAPGIAWAFTIGQLAATSVAVLSVRGLWHMHLLREVAGPLAAGTAAVVVVVVLGGFRIGGDETWALAPLYVFVYLGCLLAVDGWARKHLSVLLSRVKRSPRTVGTTP